MQAKLGGSGRFTTRPEITGTFGAVSSTHWIASQVAMSVLERGGNAFDAACAGGFVLQVVEPHLNGPAGDVPIIFWSVRDGAARVLCGQGPLPKRATRAAFAELGLDLVPGTGLTAAVVPGAFDAWLCLLRDFGTWPLEEVLAPAIAYAESGVPVVPRMKATIEAARPMFVRDWPSSSALYLIDGEAPTVGTLFRNPVLARTWRRLLTEARGRSREARIDTVRSAWSQGFVADAIDRFCAWERAMDVSGRVHGAFLRGDDLAGWSATYEDPVTLDYADCRIAKCGPWSQGPALLQTFAILDGTEVSALPPESADFVHVVVEALKLAFADREIYYGDPANTDVPLAELLSGPYAARRRDLIGARASFDWRPGDIGRPIPAFDYAAASMRRRDEGLLAAYGGGEPTIGRGTEDSYLDAAVGDTCQIDVVDRDGNMVAATPSGGWLQSSPAIAELGFPLGTRGQMTWLADGLPTTLAPGVRPRTTLTPTLVLGDDGKAYLACGTPGGDQQDQWQAVFLLRHLHHGYGLQEAIDAPSFHTEHAPNSFYPRQASPGKVVIEGRFDLEVAGELEARGHHVHVGEDWSEGRLSAVARDRNGVVYAAANPRGMQGYAVGR